MGASPTLSEIVTANQNSFYLVAGGGELNPIIHQSVVNNTTPSESDLSSFESKAETILANGAKGFGEMAALHLSYQASHPYIEIPADHSYFKRLAEVAAKHSVPIDIHLEAVNRDSIQFPEELSPVKPDGSHCFQNTEQGGNNPTSISNNIQAFKRLLQHSYTTACIWVIALKHASSGHTLVGIILAI